jgi:hypothetical protein
MKNLCSISLIIILSAELFRGCGGIGDPPVLPPVETMKIDFSDFLSPELAYSDSKVTDYSAGSGNRALASYVAGLWNTMLTAKTSIPVAAFAAASGTQPDYVDHKTWEWKYSYDMAGATYEARLSGQIQDTVIKWEMYIAKAGEGAFAEFLWFEGTTDISGTSGLWILNNSPLFQQPALKIDWLLNGQAIGTVKFTYIRESDDTGLPDRFKESYIEYGLNSNPLNAFYDIYMNISGTEDDFRDVLIEWSTVDHNGRIKANYYYQNDLWHCWDINGADAECS